MTTDLRTLHVHVESVPHTEDLSSVLLNRPAPQGGAFLVQERLPREVWDEMKSVGAVYYSADDLEDFDMFEAPAGWRYSLAAIAVPLRHGYALRVYDQTVRTQDDLHALFTPEAQAAYRARRDAARQAAARDEEQRRAAEQQERDRKGAEYTTWKEQHLADLVRTTADSPRTDPRQPRFADWTPGPRFDGNTPGAWYDGGDAWWSTQIEGQTVYACSYGNALVYYAPQALVDRWCQAQYDAYVATLYGGSEEAAASWVLGRAGQGCMGDDVPTRLLELHGADHFVRLATTSGPWMVKEDDRRTREIVERYGVPAVILPRLSIGDDLRRRLPRGEKSDICCALYVHPDGTIWARGYTYDWPLDEESAALVRRQTANG